MFRETSVVLLELLIIQCSNSLTRESTVLYRYLHSCELKPDVFDDHNNIIKYSIGSIAISIIDLLDRHQDTYCTVFVSLFINIYYFVT